MTGIGPGRKARRRGARRMRSVDLYGAQRPARADSGGGDLLALRELAWELIRRYPDDRELVLKAGQLALQVEWALRGVGSSPKDLADRLSDVLGHIGGQLLPEGYGGAELSTDFVNG